jgi:hypothetical protein
MFPQGRMVHSSGPYQGVPPCTGRLRAFGNVRYSCEKMLFFFKDHQSSLQSGTLQPRPHGGVGGMPRVSCRTWMPSIASSVLATLRRSCNLV